MPAEPVLVGAVLVYPTGTNPYIGNPFPSSISLEVGKTYLLEASGTYRFANRGEYGIADAAWNEERVHPRSGKGPLLSSRSTSRESPHPDESCYPTRVRCRFPSQDTLNDDEQPSR